jgi:hypothetical protein
LALSDARGELLKDIGRISREVVVAFRARSELKEDADCMAAVVDALREKITTAEVRSASLVRLMRLLLLSQQHLSALPYWPLSGEDQASDGPSHGRLR